MDKLYVNILQHVTFHELSFSNKSPRIFTLFQMIFKNHTYSCNYLYQSAKTVISFLNSGFHQFLVFSTWKGLRKPLNQWFSSTGFPLNYLGPKKKKQNHLGPFKIILMPRSHPRPDLSELVRVNLTYQQFSQTLQVILM